MGCSGIMLLSVGAMVFSGGASAGAMANEMLSEWYETVKTGESDMCTITPGEAEVFGTEESYSIIDIAAINVYAIGDEDKSALEGPGEDPDIKDAKSKITNADGTHNYEFQTIMCPMTVTAEKGGSRSAWSLLDVYPKRHEFQSEKFEGMCVQKMKDMDNFVVEADSTYSFCEASGASRGEWIECIEGRDDGEDDSHVCKVLDKKPTCVTEEIADSDEEKLLANLLGPKYDFSACSHPAEGNRITVAKIGNKIFDMGHKTKFDAAGIVCNGGAKNLQSEPIHCVTFEGDRPFLMSDKESILAQAKQLSEVGDIAAAGLTAIIGMLAAPCLCLGSCCCCGMLISLKQRNDELSTSHYQVSRA
jgi:hypothetical protein